MLRVANLHAKTNRYCSRVNSNATNRETLFSIIKDFTKKEIGVIMKEEFDERMSELLQLQVLGFFEVAKRCFLFADADTKGEY